MFNWPRVRLGSPWPFACAVIDTTGAVLFRMTFSVLPIVASSRFHGYALNYGAMVCVELAASVLLGASPTIPSGDSLHPFELKSRAGPVTRR
jgi:hypothetical protein